MKTILLLALMASLWFAGCASSPKPNLSKDEAARINWGERIGILTYEQALADLGPPAVLGESSAGKTAEWVLHRSPSISLVWAWMLDRSGKAPGWEWAPDRASPRRLTARTCA
jgi:hypothetical protein